MTYTKFIFYKADIDFVLIYQSFSEKLCHSSKVQVKENCTIQLCNLNLQHYICLIKIVMTFHGIDRVSTILLQNKCRHVLSSGYSRYELLLINSIIDNGARDTFKSFSNTRNSISSPSRAWIRSISAMLNSYIHQWDAR